jgi:PPOX class probable F420-dependent enzyme
MPFCAPPADRTEGFIPVQISYTRARLACLTTFCHRLPHQRLAAALAVAVPHVLPVPCGYIGLVTDLGSERYVSLTSFRRDGTPVATPVWVIGHDGRLYVWTGAQTGKVRRIRGNSDVTLAACTARGTVTGPPRPAQAAIVPASERPGVWDRFRSKYRMQLRAILWAERISTMLRRRSGQPGERVYLELTVTPEDAAPPRL